MLLQTCNYRLGKVKTCKEADKNISHARPPDVNADDVPSPVSAIYGIVSDENTGNPIRNATVESRGSGKKETKTDASGYYKQINLKNGHWKVKIKAQGYKTANAKVVLSGEESYEQNFKLKSKGS